MCSDQKVHKIGAVVDHGSDGQDDRDLAVDLIALPRRRAKRTAAALVDLAASPKIKFACIDADPETRFEVGSITKGLTGMLLADAIDRGEFSWTPRLAACSRAMRGPNSLHLPQGIVHPHLRPTTDASGFVHVPPGSTVPLAGNAPL